jgi:hypothetical protein
MNKIINKAGKPQYGWYARAGGLILSIVKSFTTQLMTNMIENKMNQMYTWQTIYKIGTNAPYTAEVK